MKPRYERETVKMRKRIVFDNVNIGICFLIPTIVVSKDWEISLVFLNWEIGIANDYE